MCSWRVGIEFLETRNLLSAVTFLPRETFTSEVVRPFLVAAEDVDGDGDQDILFASKDDGKIGWYENADGGGTFDEQHVVALHPGLVNDVFAADVDLDGHVDLLIAAGPAVFLHVNQGDGQFDAGTEIATIDSYYVMSVRSADFDGDGDVDLLLGTGREVGPEFDIPGTIAWHENVGGTFATRHPLEATHTGIDSLEVVDMDNDGDIDFTVAIFIDEDFFQPHGATQVYMNDGTGVFEIETVSLGFSPIEVGDFNGDGFPDVITAAGPGIWWYSNEGEQIWLFQSMGVASIGEDGFSGGAAVIAVDIDGDGDQDVIAAQHGTQRTHQINLFENLNGRGLFGPIETITTDITEPESLAAVDLDGDDDLDLISASSSDNSIIWYENTDGRGTYEARPITRGAVSPQFGISIPIDIDDDGDLDVVGADGATVFFHERISEKFLAAKSVILDEASTVYPSEAVGHFLYRSRRGAGLVEIDVTGNVVASYQVTPGIATNLATGDIDGDGDFDVLMSTPDSVSVAEQTTEGFLPARKVLSLQSETVRAADIDGDGDLDLVSGFTGLAFRSGPAYVAWQENLDGAGNFGDPIYLQQDPNLGANTVAVLDMDRDGDLDVIAKSERTTHWYENLDGKGTFQLAGPIFADLYDKNARDFVGARLEPIDEDGDGDLDVRVLMPRNDKYYWYENRLTGDSDDDGQVDFADFLALSANFGRRDDAEWADGDFNADESVDFRDFLLLSVSFEQGRSVALQATQS